MESDAIKQRDEALKEKEELAHKFDQISKQKDELEREIEFLREFARETAGKVNGLELRLSDDFEKRIFSEQAICISKAHESLERILKMLNDQNSQNSQTTESVSDDPKPSCEDQNEFSNNLHEDLEMDGHLQASLAGARAVSELAESAEAIFRDYEQNNRREKKELENSVISLTEENRDISKLLRSALAEKEAAEKAISKSKGGSDQRKAAIFQIAERGLQRVGFGFRVGPFFQGDPESAAFNGGGTPESGAGTPENEGEEEVFSLAFAMESIIKSTRLEITELRHSLEASRAEANHLRELSESQEQDLAKNKLRIKELEEREIQLTENVEALVKDLAVAEEDIARWREACELEAEAGKAIMRECQREIAILKQELEDMEQSLDVANNRLKLKEELVAAAMAAREAAERSLRLTDSRAAAFRERVEELSRQFEELDGRGERNSLARMRYVCWPWHWLKIAPVIKYRDLRHTSAELEQLIDLTP